MTKTDHHDKGRVNTHPSFASEDSVVWTQHLSAARPETLAELHWNFYTVYHITAARTESRTADNDNAVHSIESMLRLRFGGGRAE